MKKSLISLIFLVQAFFGWFMIVFSVLFPMYIYARYGLLSEEIYDAAGVIRGYAVYFYISIVASLICFATGILNLYLVRRFRKNLNG